jgi:hypothetical protein
VFSYIPRNTTMFMDGGHLKSTNDILVPQAWVRSDEGESEDGGGATTPADFDAQTD